MQMRLRDGDRARFTVMRPRLDRGLCHLRLAVLANELSGDLSAGVFLQDVSNELRDIGGRHQPARPQLMESPTGDQL